MPRHFIRSLSVWLLATCLLVSGIGAITHGYSHRAEHETASTTALAHKHGAKSSAAATCQLCLAFAGVGTALPSDFVFDALPSFAVFAAAPGIESRSARLRLAFRARAPPSYS